MSPNQLRVLGIGYVITGFAFFGLLVGYICGLTSSPVANAIILALFSFLGGKLFQDINKNEPKNTKISGAILGTFSLLFFIGLNLGIIIKVNEFLTFKVYQTTKKTSEADSASKTTEIDYLRSTQILNNLEAKYRKNELTDAEKNIILAEFFSKPKK